MPQSHRMKSSALWMIRHIRAQSQLRKPPLRQWTPWRNSLGPFLALFQRAGRSHQQQTLCPHACRAQAEQGRAPQFDSPSLDTRSGGQLPLCANVPLSQPRWTCQPPPGTPWSRAWPRQATGAPWLSLRSPSALVSSVSSSASSTCSSWPVG